MDYKRVLHLRFTQGMSGRKIAESINESKTTVNDFLSRFQACSALSYPLPEETTNEYIASLLYHKAGCPSSSELYRDWSCEEVHKALAKKGETLKHLWKKYNAVGMVRRRDKVVTTLDVYKEIRQLPLEGATSQRWVANTLGISRNTVK